MIKTTEFILRCKSNGLNGFILDDSVIFTKMSGSSTLICNNCGFTYTNRSKLFTSGKARCPVCDHGKVYNGHEWLERIKYNNPIHYSLYDFTQFIYHGALNKSDIICRTCGESFQITPSKFDNGQGCRLCETNRFNIDRITPWVEVEQLFNDIHGVGRYNYDLFKDDYIGYSTKSKIICNKCGNIFIQDVEHHKRGQGCSSCINDFSNKSYTHYVYKITNTINGMIYIGIHSTKNINDNYMGSGKKLKRDQHLFGMKYFTKSIIMIYESRNDILDKERVLVNEQFVNRCDTYNQQIGG